MNHDAPRQRQTDGTWAYTTANDREKGACAIGYCHLWEEYTEETIGLIFGGSRERYEAFAKPYREAAAAGKFHNGGHATADEACECFKSYLLDFELRFYPDREDANQLHRCALCTAFTSGHGEVGPYRVWPLCEAHRNRESVAGLVKIGESWHS